MTGRGQVAILLEAGMKAYASGRTQDAKAAIEEALRLEPDHPRARSLAERLFPDVLPAPGEASSRPGAAAWKRSVELALDMDDERTRESAVEGWDLPDDRASTWLEPPGTSSPSSGGEDRGADTSPRRPEAPPTGDPSGWWSEPELSDGDDVSVVWIEPDAASEEAPDVDASTVVWEAPEPVESLDAGPRPSRAEPTRVDTAALVEGPDVPRDEGMALAAEGPRAPALELLLGDEVSPGPEAEGKASGPTAEEVRRLVQGARELFELADFTGSLELVEKVLAKDPGNEEAREYLERNEGTLVQMYESKLGDLARIPRVAINPDEIVWLNIDHRAGFVLAQIDGTVSYDDIFALSGMSRIDTLRILVQLVDEKVIVTD